MLLTMSAAAWEIFACLCNGGTLVIRGSKWEPAIELVSSKGDWIALS